MLLARRMGQLYLLSQREQWPGISPQGEPVMVQPGLTLTVMALSISTTRSPLILPRHQMLTGMAWVPIRKQSWARTPITPIAMVTD